MKRRELIGKAALGTAMLVLPGVKASAAKAGAGAAKTDAQDEGHGHGHGDEVEGPLASATVSFGQWSLAQPLDRFPNQSPRLANNHQLIPHEVKIKAGGSVNFVISGFHLVLIYGNGTKPEDINRALTVLPTQGGPPLISDTTNRLYRGLDPSVFPVLPPAATPPNIMQDRVEAVTFPNPGRYLVICGVQPHFFDPLTQEFMMFGYVRVIK